MSAVEVTLLKALFANRLTDHGARTRARARAHARFRSTRALSAPPVVARSGGADRVAVQLHETLDTLEKHDLLAHICHRT